MKKACLQVMSVFLIFCTVVGCGTGKKSDSGDAANQVDKVMNEPVTLTLYLTGTALTDLEFERFFAEPLKKKYPNVTLQFLKDGKGNSPEDLVAAGTFPDIVYTSNTSFYRMNNLNIFEDLNSYVKKNNVNLQRIRPVIMDSLKLYAKNGELIAIPFALNFAALFYNQDIFNKFALDYPRDLMTWDEIMALAKKLTRSEGGMQYIGIDFTEPDRPGGQMSLPLSDPKTGLPAIDTDDWKRVLNLLKQNYELPGYIGPNNKWTYNTGAFYKDKTLAMIPNWADGVIGPIEELYKKGETMNWDVVGLPNFKEALGTGREVDIHALVLSKLSTHKEAAFKVMEFMLSDEVQTLVAKAGRFSVLENPALEKVFGADLESLKGKNIAGIFKAKPRQLHVPSDYDKTIIKPRLNDAAKRIALDNVDVNTALREAQDTAVKQVKDAIIAAQK